MGATNKNKKSVDSELDAIVQVDPSFARRRDDLAHDEADIKRTLQSALEALEDLLNQYAEQKDGAGTASRKIVEENLRALAAEEINVEDLAHPIEDGGPCGQFVAAAIDAIVDLQEQADSQNKGDHRGEAASRRSGRQRQTDEAAAQELLDLAAEIEEQEALLRDGPEALESTRQELLTLISGL
jgi:hypothetical protein